MATPTDPTRLTQLLGTVALAASDLVAAGAAAAPSPEADALVHLRAWPETSLAALAAVVGRSQPATVRLVDRLVERGLVTRAPGPDRRTLALPVTAAGAAAAEAFLRGRAAALEPLLADLDATERAQLEPLLARVVAGLAEGRTGAVRACRQCDREVCATGPGCPLEHTMDAETARRTGGG